MLGVPKQAPGSRAKERILPDSANVSTSSPLR